jgi:hypothetical protein
MRPIAVLDLETDPFEYGQMVNPFVAGYYDGSKFISYWADNCVEQLVTFLTSLSDHYIIYAHNGGRFDYFWFLPYLNRDLRIVNSRIIQARLGNQELRDSFAIMPFALEQYKKTPIDYNKFKADKREKHRDEILSYLRDDCVDLHTLCTAFHSEFGDALTIGSASMRELKKFHSFRTGTGIYDAKLRTKFYFGGRNQVFKAGIVTGPIRVYDVNSMYPYVMRDYLHPISTGLYRSSRIETNTCFVSVRGKNYGAFPTRQKDGSLDFTVSDGDFHTTIHEFNAALETGTFKPDRIIETIGFSERASFDEFVNHFYNARAKAKKEGDEIKKLFYKFVLNSGYGKFAQNPENYANWYITEIGEYPEDWHDCTKTCDDPCRKKWSPSFTCNQYIIWERPLLLLNYYNIAIGASITGAARAVLLKGIAHADSPFYVDTDSIICRRLSGVSLSDSDLGAWKLEAQGTHAAICGKKLYAVFDGPDCIKKAHKGARLSGDEIVRIAAGESVESCNPVPTFKWNGAYSFTKRTIQRTA